jgi:hypothetical protein
MNNRTKAYTYDQLKAETTKKEPETNGLQRLFSEAYPVAKDMKWTKASVTLAADMIAGDVTVRNRILDSQEEKDFITPVESFAFAKTLNQEDVLVPSLLCTTPGGTLASVEDDGADRNVVRALDAPCIIGDQEHPYGMLVPFTCNPEYFQDLANCFGNMYNIYQQRELLDGGPMGFFYNEED